MILFKLLDSIWPKDKKQYIQQKVLCVDKSLAAFTLVI